MHIKRPHRRPTAVPAAGSATGGGRRRRRVVLAPPSAQKSLCCRLVDGLALQREALLSFSPKTLLCLFLCVFC